MINVEAHAAHCRMARTLITTRRWDAADGCTVVVLQFFISIWSSYGALSVRNIPAQKCWYLYLSLWSQRGRVFNLRGTREREILSK